MTGMMDFFKKIMDKLNEPAEANDNTPDYEKRFEPVECRFCHIDKHLVFKKLRIKEDHRSLLIASCPLCKRLRAAQLDELYDEVIELGEIDNLYLGPDDRVGKEDKMTGMIDYFKKIMGKLNEPAEANDNPPDYEKRFEPVECPFCHNDDNLFFMKFKNEEDHLSLLTTYCPSCKRKKLWADIVDETTGEVIFQGEIDNPFIGHDDRE